MEKVPTTEKHYLLPITTLSWLTSAATDTHTKDAVDLVLSNLAKHPPEEYVLRSDWDFERADKIRCVKLIEEIYALLSDDKVTEAKELLQKRVNNRNVNIPFFIDRH